MPIHDWSRIPDGIFHHFHHDWITAIARALNTGILPRDYYALAEQNAGRYAPDVLALQRRDDRGSNGLSAPGASPRTDLGGTTVAIALPETELVVEAEAAPKPRRQKAIVIRHVSDDSVVAMVELVSPGNKSGNDALREFVEKSARLVRGGVHLVIVDLQPRTKRDPHGIHPPIWEELTTLATTLPDDRPLTAVAYEAASPLRAHIQPLAVGLPLPTMPLYLEPGFAVPVPLEATYQTSLAGFPERWRTVLEGASG
jgi:hypothetical protein